MSDYLPALFLALSPAYSLIQTPQQAVFQLAFRIEHDPGLTDSIVRLAFEFRVNAYLRRGGSGRTDLNPEGVAAFSPIANIGGGHVAVVFQLAPGSNTSGELYRLADQQAFTGKLIAVFLIQRYLAGFEHLFGRIAKVIP